MQRDYTVYLEDILDSIRKIETYTENLTFDEFVGNELKTDGVVRNLEIIGEAVKNLPENVKIMHPDTEWKKIAGLRDILTHAYFGVDLQIIWESVNKNFTSSEIVSSLESYTF
ncbi:MAG: hypothetical protein MSIBF_06780 [Candidatus Altiarchaeales archaeon IMC4]|nr:MAG: hypothetical protein MSIBF_06780 [Candidatus Altiarchaeales archaeon IMC4]